MKKLFLMIAMSFVTLVAFGQTTLEIKAMEFAKQTFEALKAGDDAKIQRVDVAAMTYYNTLSSTNQVKFERALLAAVAELEAIDEVGATKAAAVKAKAKSLANKMVVALKAGDMAKIEVYALEGQQYLETLSEKESVLFSTIVDNIGKAAGL